jgi:hypothetical protein
MTVQNWIFRVYAYSAGRERWRSVVGAGESSTVEKALRLAEVPESMRSEIRFTAAKCGFADGSLKDLWRAVRGLIGGLFTRDACKWCTPCKESLAGFSA